MGFWAEIKVDLSVGLKWGDDGLLGSQKKCNLCLLPALFEIMKIIASFTVCNHCIFWLPHYFANCIQLQTRARGPQTIKIYFLTLRSFYGDQWTEIVDALKYRILFQNDFNIMGHKFIMIETLMFQMSWGKLKPLWRWWWA